MQCVMGKVNDECDGCMCQDHTILGSVRSAGGLLHLELPSSLLVLGPNSSL